MSRNEWEEGTLQLSQIGYRKLTTELFAAVNAMREEDFSTLERLRKAILEAGKGSRGRDWGALFDEQMEKTDAINSWGYASTYRKPVFEFHTMQTWDARSKLVETRDPATGKLSTHAPKAVKKSDFAPLSTRSTKSLSAGEGTISFDPANRLVRWHVSKNNHACRDARDSKVGQAFWKALGKVEWTRGTGGVIVGNDEYNSDDRSNGGGANYATGRFGPLGAEDRPRSKAPSFGLSR